MKPTWLKNINLLLQAVLWLSFIVAANDPGLLGGLRPTGTLINNYMAIVDPLYKITDILTMPVKMLFQVINVYNPAALKDGFPYMSFHLISNWSYESTGGTNRWIPDNLLPGFLNFWIPMTSFLISIVYLQFMYHFESIRNFLWNVVVEYMFHRKKVKMYEQALDQRNADLAKMNTRYSTLAQETHSLKDSVITDELTRIYNKRFFLNRMQLEFDICKQERVYFSIIMIDIDFFKRLNDNYGHLSGDEVLKSVAAVMKRFSPEQCYPCRYGGEEFAIIMPRKTIGEALEAARLIQENVQMLHFDNIDKNLRVTVSQGICCVDFSTPDTQSMKTYETLLELADQQLYKSKMEGRNRVSFVVLKDTKAA